MSEPRSNPDTRQEILRAALKCFAHAGYAAASVQHIVNEAQVSKPTLYYYFQDKAQLFEALVEQAHDERYRLMREAAERGQSLADKLEEVVAAIFDFALNNRELMRLSFATAFAASGEVPDRAKCGDKGRRNYEFVRSLVEMGQASGELDCAFTADALAMGLYGQFITYVMVRLVVPDCPLDREAARNVVRLFLEGAASHGKAPGSVAAQMANGAGATADRGTPHLH